MICNNLQPANSRGKRGISFVYTLILATFVTIISILLAILLNNFKPNPIIPATTLISADYQMESAIIRQMQKYRNNHKNEPKGFSGDIMPGITMVVDCSKINENEWLFEAKVSGRGISRSIKVKSNEDIPDKLIFLE